MDTPALASADTDYVQLRTLSAAALRERIRPGHYQGHTAGLAAGKLQTNLVILPERYALDFFRFCQRNPKPCPLVGVSDSGDPMLRTLGDIDIRRDVPRYNVYRDGQLGEQTTDIAELWQDDFVAFALGCSYTFEDALQRDGISLKHIDRNQIVSMYRSNIATVPAGPFGDTQVVSMRPIKTNRLADVVELCRRFPLAHGAPVHAGDPADIGIAKLDQPDWGEPVEVGDDETPVFWACGVTPQNAVMRAALPLCITHSPGHMLITDVDDTDEVPVLAS